MCHGIGSSIQNQVSVGVASRAAQSLSRRFCTGAEGLEEAKEMQRQLTELHSKGGFDIRRWSSNAPEVLTEVPEVSRETPVILPSEELGIKVLGVMWDHSCDAFVVKFESSIISKRTILSYIAKIYDIMGYFNPTIFIAKRFMQRLWLCKLDWDEAIPVELRKEWVEYCNDLPELSKIKIPRFLNVLSKKVRLVGSCDASEKGMATCAYIQTSEENLAPQAYLIKAKSKLTPLKTLTIPRLELCAALLLARLVKPILQFSQIKFDSVHLYTDSSIVLVWLNHPLNELKTFVCNRVSEILHLVPDAIWGHVSGTDNPADLGSRGVSATALKNSNLWWYGPSFLKLPLQNCPAKLQNSISLKELPEIKATSVLSAQIAEPVDTVIRRFSSLSRMQRVLGYMRRFIINTRRRVMNIPNLQGPLSTSELDAVKIAVRLSQEESFGSDVTKIRQGRPPNKQLQKLSPFFDERDQLVRVGGRLKRALFLPLSARHPILLTKNSHLSILIADHYHRLMLHSGPRATCAAIQRKFLITSPFSLVKGRIHRCLRCYKLNAKPIQPVMADVIPGRMQRAYCWASCVLDFGGPFTTKESRGRKSTTHKSYFCLFICLTTRAVHIESVSDLTAAAFLAALHRFVARRSVPTTIYSDRGTNFVCGRRILRECKEFLVNHQEEILSSGVALGIKWILNAPYGPNFNGCAENGVKSAKAVILRQVGDKVLTFEEFHTLMCRVEQVLNSRPLSFSSRDVRDRDILYLTPGHFITGREMMTPPEEIIHQESSLHERWKMVRQMAQSFWNGLLA